MSLERIPDLDNRGLVVRPPEDNWGYLGLQYFKKPPLAVDKHHLYWPAESYRSKLLTKKFREHPYNVVWLPKIRHDQIHDEYDGVPIPSEEVMQDFMSEADLLRRIRSMTNGIKNLDHYIAVGEIILTRRAQKERQRKIDYITEGLFRVINYSVVNPQVSHIVVEQAANIALAA